MTSTAQRVTTVHHAPILVQLHHEWNRIVLRARELHRVRSWGLPGMPVESLDDILDRCGYRRPPADLWPDLHGSQHGPHHEESNANDYLLRLVRLAQHDQLAARIVLQRILPALCSIARRHA